MTVEFISCSGAKAGQPNAHMIVSSGGRILLDCGSERRSPPKYLAEMERPDVLWISHAHGDHCGALLDLMEKWPKLAVMATKDTVKLLRVALDGGRSASISARVDAVLRRIRRVPWRKFRPLPGVEGARIMAVEAGHIPGAAMAVLEIEDGERTRRVLYTGDFCTHDQTVVKGAGVPVFEGGVDWVICEAMLANDKEADSLEYRNEADALRLAVEEAVGPVLIGVSSIGESAEVAALLASTKKRVMADEYLREVLEVSREALGQELWSKLTFGDRRRLKGHLSADGVVIAPGDQYRRKTAAAVLAEPLLSDPSATIVVLNRARKKTGAGRLLSAKRGGLVDWQGRDVKLGASVIHRRLINHAPRWQLKGLLMGVGAQKTFLVHGTTGARWGLKRALKRDGFAGEVEVVEVGERW